MLKYFIILTLLVSTFSSASTDASQIREYKFIMQEYEPFNWTEDGVLKGGMLEVAKAACENLKIICRFESLPMKRVISMLEDGSTTGVLSLIENSDRAAYATLSIPIIDSNMGYFSLKGKFKKVKSLKDLAGATVGTVETSSAEKLVIEHQKKVDQLNRVSETGLSVVLNKLIAGRYGEKGLAFANQDVFMTSLKKLNINNVETVFVTHTEQFKIAFSKKSTSPEFIEKFNAEILRMKKTGQLKKILKPFKLKPS